MARSLLAPVLACALTFGLPGCPDDDVPGDADDISDDDDAAPDWCAVPGFDADAPWRRSIAAAEIDPASAAIIAHLQDVGFGLGRLQMDFSMEVLCADDAPFLEWTPNDAFYDGECDEVPVPVPEGGAIEGHDDYRCEGGGDCHLIVVHRPTARLYEQFVVDIGETYSGGCLAVWALDDPWPEGGRGADCTSADAAGLPIAPLLFDADEVAAGEVDHALRFILPNDRIRNRAYVDPATHATGAASGGDESLPYGGRLRLRADYPLDSLPHDAARTVARALQTYGMILVDGGSVALSGRSDRFTEAKWADLLESRDLDAIQPADFDVVALGDVHRWAGDCRRNDYPPPP